MCGDDELDFWESFGKGLDEVLLLFGVKVDFDLID
jgi:hypothetical protein